MSKLDKPAEAYAQTAPLDGRKAIRPHELSFSTSSDADSQDISRRASNPVTDSFEASAHHAYERSNKVLEFNEDVPKGVTRTSSHGVARIKESSNDSIRRGMGPDKELIESDVIVSPRSIEIDQDGSENDLVAMEPEQPFVDAESSMTRESEIAHEPIFSDSHKKINESSKNSWLGLPLEVIGIQGGFNAKYVAIPPTEKEDFQHIALFGAIGFPKRYNYDSGWEIRFRMNGSMGVLRGAGELGFIATIVPGIVFWYPKWNISINGGPGVAFVSREKYGEQDLGGPIQIVGQGGLTYYVTDHIGLGWRFHHISDAGIWGSDNRGVDVNLFELTYKF
ncbi:MAG: acyloxyacyl hydrolase [Nitrospirales bacterium]|nr:acyloxyacyl hydrolase [Nitrospira sp.]MDR4502819.1 acyloxyacyl hydrolase [Nitrospirales bacterium]